MFNVYTQGSLKAATREKRGKGVRRRVEFSSKMPSNWKSSLRVNENKTVLFHLLAEETTGRDLPEKQVFITYGDKVQGDEIKSKFNNAPMKRPTQD